MFVFDFLSGIAPLAEVSVNFLFHVQFMISVSHPDAKVWASWLYLRPLNRCENLTWHSWTPLYSPCHVMFMCICFHCSIGLLPTAVAYRAVSHCVASCMALSTDCTNFDMTIISWHLGLFQFIVHDSIAYCEFISSCIRSQFYLAHLRRWHNWPWMTLHL